MNWTEAGVWSFRYRSNDSLSDILVKLTEELGELAHAHYRLLNTSSSLSPPERSNYEAKLRDAVGDVALTLMVYAFRSNIDYEEAIDDAWEIVKERT